MRSHRAADTIEGGLQRPRSERETRNSFLRQAQTRASDVQQGSFVTRRGPSAQRAPGIPPWTREGRGAEPRAGTAGHVGRTAVRQVGLADHVRRGDHHGDHCGVVVTMIVSR